MVAESGLRNADCPVRSVGRRAPACPLAPLVLVVVLVGTVESAETPAVARPDAINPHSPIANPRWALPPFIVAPQLPRSSGLLPARTWLPPASAIQAPRLLPVEAWHPIRQRPVVDLPEVVSMPPLGRYLVTGLPAWALAPDVTRLLELAIGTNYGRSLPPRLPAIPPAATPQAPRRLPTEGQQALRRRPAPDSPAIATASDPFELRPPAMPTAPRAYAPAPELAAAPLLSPAFVPRAERPTPAADPTWDHSSLAAIARAPELTRTQAPFVRLAIPDPFELAALVALRTPPPDDDPPTRAPGLPPRPTLPAKP